MRGGDVSIDAVGCLTLYGPPHGYWDWWEEGDKWVAMYNSGAAKATFSPTAWLSFEAVD